MTAKMIAVAKTFATNAMGREPLNTERSRVASPEVTRRFYASTPSKYRLVARCSVDSGALERPPPAVRTRATNAGSTRGSSRNPHGPPSAGRSAVEPAAHGRLRIEVRVVGEVVLHESVRDDDLEPVTRIAERQREEAHNFVADAFL